MNMYTKIANNGVNTEFLLGAREALTESPAGASFKWRATCDWVNGTHSCSEVEGFYGLGDEQQHKTRFNFDADHPGVFAAEDNRATPGEYVLVGLVCLLNACGAAVAQHRNIQLHSVRATIEGDMDIQGILGIDSDVRNGYQGIRVHFDIDADGTPEELEAVVAQSQKRSAVFDIIANPTQISVTTQ
jgi:uncharacterized OsmC-like protein